MDEYLRSVRSALRAGGFEAGSSVHVVLGGPEVDVDTVASTLSLALHLSQNSPEGPSLCVPVLLGGGGGGVEGLPAETVEYLRRVEVRESSLVWRRDVDLRQLHGLGSLSLTLLGDHALDSPERDMLGSSVMRVVHRRGQREEEEAASSAATVVAREILQGAAERVRGVLGEVLGEALIMQRERLLKDGRHSSQLEELVESLGKWREVTAVQHGNDDSKLHDKDIEQQLTQMLKEFTDGEISLALTSMIAEAKDWHGYLDDFKSFCHRHNYDSLVVVKYAVQSLHPMVAVYSDSTEILNQICCELEDSSLCSQSGSLESEEFIQGCLQVYQLPEDVLTSTSKAADLEHVLRGRLKAFIERRRFVLACHPSSRSSSTEGVAGSVGFSQGSSGITDMYGSDTERTCTDEVSMAGEMADREADPGSAGVAGGGGELVSPDSGMATIRSSRSSKESSVFLSDDSPVGEIMTGAMAPAGQGGLLLRNPSPLGFSSLSTPVPPERRKQRSSRKKSDALELFHFDPLQNIDTSLPVEAPLEHSAGNGAARRAVSSSLSDFEELSLVDFYAPKLVSVSENAPSLAEHTELYCGDTLDTEVPSNLVNSLLGSCQEQTHCSERFQEVKDEGFAGHQPKQSLTSSLSEVWEEYGVNSTKEQTIDDGDISHLNMVGEFVGNILDENQVKGSSMGLISNYQKDKILKPQLSLITDIESTLNMDSGFTQSLGTSTLADLQLTPPVEDIDGMIWSGLAGVHEKLSSVARKRQRPSTLTPESSKEDYDGIQRKKGDRQVELQDFWSYSAEKGFIQSDSKATASYPESLDMWNTTIRDDSISPLTTPDIDNLPALSTSNRVRAEGAVQMESLSGYSEYGMVMWNTTIAEDSSSSVGSPDGPEPGKDSGLSHDLPRCVPGIHMNQFKDLKNAEHEKHTATLAAEEGVKIFVEELVGKDNVRGSHICSDLAEHDMKAGDQNNMTSTDQTLVNWAIPVPQMVISTSEYDNLGACTWTSTPSPQTHASPDTHIIQLDGESSPFIAMLQPNESVDGQSAQCHQHYCSESEQDQRQVFLFDEINEFDCTGSTIQTESLHEGKDCLKMMSTGLDCEDQPTLHSPFILVNDSPVANSLASFYLASPDKDIRENLHTIAEFSKSALTSDLSLDCKKTVVGVDDASATEGNGDAHVETKKYVEGAAVDTTSLSPISRGEKDALRCSHDSLLLSSRDELRSNSDGDSSSGLEMDSILVSGSVTESKGVWSNGLSRAWQTGGSGQVGDAERSMETFSMLSCAATLLKAQESRTQCRQKQTISENNGLGSSARENEVILSETVHARPSHSDHTSSIEGACFVECDAELTADISSSTEYLTTTKHCPQITHTREDPIFLETAGANITKAPREVVLDQDALASCRSLSQAAQASSDGQSNTVVRSMSSSLRHPSDHFLRTREEVYVHSQISMEDSDDGMQSPSGSAIGSTLLAGESAARETPQTGSEQPWAELTHSSFSHNSSYTGTPENESGPGAERAGVGSPFGGDLIQGLYHERDGEDPSLEHAASTSLNKGLGMERDEGGDIEMPRTGSMQGECTAQPVDGQTMESTRGVVSQSREYSPPEQPTALHPSRLSGHLDIGDGSSDPPSHRFTDGTSQAFGLTPCGNNVYQWTRSCFTDQSDDQSDRHGDPEAHVAAQQETSDLRAPDLPGEGQHGAEEYAHFLPTGSYEQEDYTASILKTGKELNRMDDEADDQDGFHPSRMVPAQPRPAPLGHSQGSPVAGGDAGSRDAQRLNTGDVDMRSQPPPFSPRAYLASRAPGNTVHMASDAGRLSRGPPCIHGRGPDARPAGTGAAAALPDAIPEYSAAEERRDSALWRSVSIGEQEHLIDMQCIQPYRRVVSHGGYYGEQNAIIVFAACFLPDSNREDYNHVMENLFLYVISTLELMVAEDYMIVYLNGATPRRKMPGLSWMRKCYQMIDRRLKKNLKLFIIVHPSWFIRTVLGLTRPFISNKFSSKIKYVHSLAELSEMVPMEYVQIPASIMRYEEEEGIHTFACTSLDKELQRSADKDKKRGTSAM